MSTITQTVSTPPLHPLTVLKYIYTISYDRCCIFVPRPPRQFSASSSAISTLGRLYNRTLLPIRAQALHALTHQHYSKYPGSYSFFVFPNPTNLFLKAASFSSSAPSPFFHSTPKYPQQEANITILKAFRSITTDHEPADLPQDHNPPIQHRPSHIWHDPPRIYYAHVRFLWSFTALNHSLRGW